MRIARGAALDAFLDKLRDERFVIGVDRLILVEQILQTHGDTLTPKQLQSRLRPLLASSQEQQEQFDKLFTEWFLTEPQKKIITPPDRRWIWPAIALAVVAITIGWRERNAYDLPPLPPPPQIKGLYEPPVPLVDSAVLAIGQPATFDASRSKSYTGGPLGYKWKLIASPPGSKARLANANQRITSLVPDLPGDYGVELTVHDGIRTSDPFPVFSKLTDGAVPGELLPCPGPDRWTHTADLTLFDLTPVRWLLIPLGLAFLYLLKRYRDRRRILDRFRRQDRKFQHNIRALTLAPETRAESSIRAAIRALRRPAQGQPKLNIPKSIDSTIRNGGVPTLRFESPRRRPEYLILIDTLASRDHQSTLFQTMVRTMDKKGLQVYAYLYAGDPRVCRPMPGVTKGGPKTLVDLAVSHTTARLLLFGDAGQLFYEQSAEVQPWAKPLFAQWPERIIFTPKTVSQWSDRERELAGKQGFLLLPALQDSLRSRQTPPAAFEFYEPAWDYANAESLRVDLTANNVYQWLAACALYPRLEWILTMRLGVELDLYSEQGCLELVRLPWFRQGEMPLELQEELVESMSPTQRQRARQAMSKLLEEAIPPGKTADDDGGETNFEIAVQQLDLSPAERQQIRRDLAVARVAVRSDKPWYLQLPARLRNWLLIDSRWMSRRNRQLFATALALFFTGAVGMMGTVGSARIDSTRQGPSAPGPAARVNPLDGLKYVYIPPGRFRMGCSPGDSECLKDEYPIHEVQITKGFWLGQTEVTNKAYDRFKKTSGPAQRRQLPKVEVSWDEATAFCERSGGGLPTEAEWEYAARAGTTTPRYGPLDAVAWYTDNSNSQAHPVATKTPNAWRLYDVLGNVSEWTQDWYRPTYDYPPAPSGDFIMLRGGRLGQRFNLRARLGSWQQTANRGVRLYRLPLPSR